MDADIPDHLEDLIVIGVVEASGADRYCVPSPSLLQLTLDAIDPTSPIA